MCPKCHAVHWLKWLNDWKIYCPQCGWIDLAEAFNLKKYKNYK